MALSPPVNYVSAQGSGTSLTIGSGIMSGWTIPANDVLHVNTHVFSNISTAPGTPTDSTAGSNTWHARTPSTWSSTFRSVVGQAWTLVAVAPTTVSVSGTAGTADIAGEVYQLTGLDKVTTINTSSTNTSAGSTNPANTAISSAVADEIWIAASTHDGAAITPGAPSGFTLKSTTPNYDGSAAEPFASGYEVFTSAQTSLAPAWSNSAVANYGLALAAYKGAAVASAVPAPPSLPFISNGRI